MHKQTIENSCSLINTCVIWVVNLLINSIHDAIDECHKTAFHHITAANALKHADYWMVKHNYLVTSHIC